MDSDYCPSPSPTKEPKKSVKRNTTTTAARNKPTAKKAAANNKGAKKLSPVKRSILQDDVVTVQSDNEDESYGAGDQVSAILSKLGSELQQRMKAKRQRLEACFLSVKDTPNSILKTLNSNSEERSKLIQEFQAKSSEMVKQVENVVELQKATEEKLNRLIFSAQKHFDSIKDSLNGCLTGLQNTIKQFENVSSDDTDQLEGKHDEDAKRQLENIQKELGLLQKKILQEGQQEETENIKSSFKLI